MVISRRGPSSINLFCITGEANIGKDAQEMLAAQEN
jgi:hypothetical protein